MNTKLRLKSVGTSLAAAGAAFAGYALIDGDATAKEWAGFLTSGNDFGAKAAQNIVTSTLGTKALSTVSNVAGGVGVFLGVMDTVNALKERDLASAGFNAAGTAGSALMMAGALGAGAAFTGVGAVLCVGALVGTLALGQYRKVEASNHFESEDTENYLKHALADSGLTGQALDDATHELRNADSDGRLTGVLMQAAAEQMNMNPKDLLNLIARQDTDVLKDIIEKGHWGTGSHSTP